MNAIMPAAIGNTVYVPPHITIIKAPLASAGEKPNLFKLLKNHGNGVKKSTVFKTIGNRIVVPMKVCVPTMKPTDDRNVKMVSVASKKTLTTFQMAVPRQGTTTNDGKLSSVGNLPFRKANPSALLIQRRKEPLMQTIVKKEPGLIEPMPNDQSEYGGLFRFAHAYPLPAAGLTLGDGNNHGENAKFASSYSKCDLSLQTYFSSIKQEVEDDDLTSLSWLSHSNKELHDTIRKCNPDDPGIGLSGDEMENDENVTKKKMVFTATSPINGKTKCCQPAEEYSPTNKPPYSFSCLIFMAIEDSYLKRLPVKEIYTWVCQHFPYFRTAPSGWKNSIRHNLSLNRCFKKAECGKDTAKGSLWCIDPAYRPNLIQALKRTPYYPFLHPTGIGQPLSLSNLVNLLPGVQTGRVPSWSPNTPPSWADAQMASAALNLMGLRDGPPNRSESITNTLEEILSDPQILSTEYGTQEGSKSEESIDGERLVIRGSSQDHIYMKKNESRTKMLPQSTRCSSPESEKSAPDAAYEFETRGFSGDDFDDDLIEDVMEGEVIIGEDGSNDENDTDKESQQSLFDSGFGSMKDFEVKNSRKRKLKSMLDKEEESIPKRRTVKSKLRSCGRSNRKQTKSSTNTKKKHSIKVKVSKSSSVPSAKKVKIEKKNSDVDSGKDSPKVDRSSRGKRLKQRNSKKLNNLSYDTRSSRPRLRGQEQDKRGSRNITNRRKFSLSSDQQGPDEEEEIKLAAGSLLRLAGLLKSPDAPSKSS